MGYLGFDKTAYIWNIKEKCFYIITAKRSAEDINQGVFLYVNF